MKTCTITYFYTYKLFCEYYKAINNKIVFTNNLVIKELKLNNSSLNKFTVILKYSFKNKCLPLFSFFFFVKTISLNNLIKYQHVISVDFIIQML